MVKLYATVWENPLFGNNPIAEATALEALEPLAIAPRLVKQIKTPDGHAVVYSRIAGNSSPLDPFDVGVTLAKLHGSDLRHQIELPHAKPLREMFHAIISDLTERQKARLNTKFPATFWRDTPQNPPCFLHFDPTPSNIVTNENGAFLIDWQTPKLGDPCHDIAMFLAPSMRFNYGYKPATQTQTDRFFQGYGNSEIKARWEAIKQQYHAVLAAYSLWRLAHGLFCDRESVAAELDLSEQI